MKIRPNGSQIIQVFLLYNVSENIKDLPIGKGLFEGMEENTTHHLK